MKLFFKYLSIFVILVTITSCSNKENEENVTSDTTKEILTESNVDKDIITDSNEDKQIVSGTFGSDGAFTSETIKLEVSEDAPEEGVNGQTYDKIFEEFIFHITDPTEYTGLSDKTKLLEQFIDKNNNKFGKFYIQKTLANYIFYYYSTMPEGLAGKEYILFDEKTFTSKVTISQFELDKPEFSKNNNYNNLSIENIYLLELEKNAINKLPNFSSKVDDLLQKIFTRDSEARLFNTNSVNLFFIFELLNSKNEKQICTLALPNKISLYTMDADYGSSYDNFYKNSTDTSIKANLPYLSSVVGKIQAFTSFYTTCISA